jgi:hypothetical protein
MARKRKHPLVHLVVWLGISLAMSLLLLIIVAARLPTADVLDRTFQYGMAEGSVMCLDLERQFDSATEPKPVAPAPQPSKKGNMT